MNLFRIAREKYIRDLSGEGARRYGGRWNKKGDAVLYTSTHESLAVLELLAHVSLQLMPNDLHVLVLSLPDHIDSTQITPKQLPRNWQSYPAPVKLAETGSKWLISKKTLMLRVPSVIIPGEQNVLLNPGHPQMEQVRIQKVRTFSFDSRILSDTEK